MQISIAIHRWHGRRCIQLQLTFWEIQQNADIRAYLSRVAQSALHAAAGTIMIATIIEDIYTLGYGIADDWSSFVTARTLVNAARAIRIAY